MPSDTLTIKMNGNSVYFANQYLLQGEYNFLINAPFNTQMIVTPVNPVAGLSFLDQDATPNVFNATLKVPQEGQYGFKITLDRPVSDGQLDVLFTLLSQTGGGDDDDDDGGTGDSAGGGSNGGAPGKPSPDWLFIYAAQGNPDSNLNVTVRNGRYLINWYNGKTHQTFYTWRCSHETETGLICDESQNPNVTQRLGISKDWKTIWMGTAVKFVYVKKQRL